MDLTITLGLGGLAILIVGSLIFGGVAQFVGETRTGYEWLVDAIAAGSAPSSPASSSSRGRRWALSLTGSRWCQPSWAAWWSDSRWRSRPDTSPVGAIPTGRCLPEASRVGR